MKTIIKVFLVIMSLNSFGQTNKTQQTVIYLVRHAEQDASIKENPPLSEKGIARANLLADILSKTPISAAYTTTLARASGTAQPLLAKNKIEITNYKLEDDEEQLVNGILQKYKGKNVLIIGHSGNIVELLNAATKSKDFDNSAIEDFSDFYIITFIGDAPGVVSRLKYGQ